MMEFDDESERDLFFLLKYNDYILMRWYTRCPAERGWVIRQGQRSTTGQLCQSPSQMSLPPFAFLEAIRHKRTKSKKNNLDIS